MDQIKIGKFIKERRKEKNLTQTYIAEKLCITDRAISKWENGICMPDVSIIPELCNLLDISINDLFSGEIVNMKNNEKKLEENLLDLAKQKELQDKRMLNLEIVIGFTSSITFMSFIFLASYLEMPSLVRILLIIVGIIIFAVGCGYCIMIEQTAGYYECSKCHNKYIPTYQSVLWSEHIGRARKLKCPKCGKKSWHKKVISNK